MKSGLTALLFMSLLPASAFAEVGESQVSLRLEGAIVSAAACDMTIGNGAIDFGRLTLDDLNPDPSKPTVLEEKRIPMRIDCASPRRYAVVASGNTPAAGVHKDFGLFSQTDNAQVGSLYVRFDSWSVHIESVDGFYTWTNDASDLASARWGDSTGETMPVPIAPAAIGFVTSVGSYAPPSPIRQFDTFLLVDPRIRPVNELGLLDELTFSGNLGFEITYF